MTKNKTVHLDDDHNIVSEEKARWRVEHTYNQKGELVEEVWIDLKVEKKK